MFKRKTTLFLCATVMAAGVGVTLFNSRAKADLFSECARRPGTLRFYDFETDRCGYISGNHDGEIFGDPLIRGDQFGNDAISNVCLYLNPHCQGVSVLLQRGVTVDWPNSVRSVRWTTASFCSTGC
jgi:hypothetical protein